MYKTKHRNWYAFFLMLLFTLFLIWCNTTGEFIPEEVNEEDASLETLELPLEEFHKVVGWISDEEILVHYGDIESHNLSTFNIYTSEMNLIIESE